MEVPAEVLKIIPRGIDEKLQGLTDRHDIYPAIDPQAAFSGKAFTGKVVVVTGASRGIGALTATFYARAGAKLALLARSASNLEAVKKDIQQETGAEVLTFAVDVKDAQATAKAVQNVVDEFGKIDAVIANAGAANPADGKMIGARDVSEWWNTVEVNVLGAFNIISPAIQHLRKTNGYVVAISSIGAHTRLLASSDYSISKFALNRLIEFVALENSGSLHAFALHPGAILTDMGKASRLPEQFFIDTPELPAATILALTSGKYDWLNGRFVDATQDLDDVEKLKEKILSKDALVNKLALV